jgi:hypothetical protein
MCLLPNVLTERFMCFHSQFTECLKSGRTFQTFGKLRVEHNISLDNETKKKKVKIWYNKCFG